MTHQQTSLLAFQQIKPKMGKRQEEVFNALCKLCEQQEDATDQEIRVFLGKDEPNYVRPRRYELVNSLKKVCSSNKRKCKVTGKVAIAWKPL